MGFLSVCTAIYDYQAQAEGELEIKEGDLLFILEKSDDTDWWKAKKRAAADDEDEPVGLIPNNYVEEVSAPAFQPCVYRRNWPQTSPQAVTCYLVHAQPAPLY